MLSEIILKAALYEVLYRVDQELAEALREKGCPQDGCQGALHQANYSRKPRGGPDEIRDALLKRRSFCCALKGCRRRATPLSVLFMGRRVFWRVAVVITVTLLQEQQAEHSVGKLSKRFGMDPRTLKRWMTYFSEVFPSSQTWERLRGRVSCDIRNDFLPKDLLDHFLKYQPVEAGFSGVTACLSFLANRHGF